MGLKWQKSRIGASLSMLIFNVIQIKCIEFKRAIFSMMLLLLLFSNYFLTLSQSCVLLFGIHYKETFPILQEKSEHASYMCNIFLSI